MHLFRDMEKLKARVLPVCTRVEENIHRALQLVEKDNPEVIRDLMRVENEIDHAEIEIEEECLKILALHQPVAKDLRYVVAILKINNDLERMGDMCAHIVERLDFVNRELARTYIEHLLTCGQKVKQMVRISLDCFINLDRKLASEVQKMDDEVDTQYKSFSEEMKNCIRKRPEELDTWINLMFVSKQLERIADHANNIVCDVRYFLDGDIHRHEAVRV